MQNFIEHRKQSKVKSRARVERSFKENFISTLVKSFVLVLSPSFFVYCESVHMPAKKKKDLFCRSGKRASRKDSTKRKLFPKQRETKLKESDEGSYHSQTEQWLEECDVE